MNILSIIISSIFGDPLVVEILWTGIAIVGLIFSSINYLAARKTVAKLKNLPNKVDHVEWRVSNSLRTTEFMRFIVQMTNLSIGLIAFTVPPIHLSQIPLKYQIIGYAFRWGLVLGATLTAAQSVNLYRLRQFFARERTEDER